MSKVIGDYVIVDEGNDYGERETRNLLREAESKKLLVVFGGSGGGIRKLVMSMTMKLLFGQGMARPEARWRLVQKDLFNFLDIEGKTGLEVACKLARLKIPVGEIEAADNWRNGLGWREAAKIIIQQGFRDLHYGALDRVLRGWREKMAEDELDLDGGKVIWDAGCGRQANLGWKVRHKLKQYVGIDWKIVPGKIGNVTLVKKDIARIGEMKGKADKIVCLAVIEHLDEPKKFIAGCWKVLNEGGKLIITTPQPKAEKWLWRLVRWGLIDGNEVEEHKRYFRPDNLMEMLKNEGFEIEKQREFAMGANCLTVAVKI